MAINHVLDILRMMYENYIFMGVRTYFIFNQAGDPHVSIWKAFTKTHRPLIDNHLETCQFHVLNSV